jgi:hypothetical protein
MSIYRLVYRSRATLPVNQDTVAAIVDQSMQNNKRLDITGLLLATRTHFFQVLEGSRESVNQVYHRIVRDPRHTDLVLVSYGPIHRRAFEDWSMRGLELGLLGRMLGQQLKEKYGETDGHVQLPLEPDRAFALLYDVKVFLQRGPLEEE